MIVYASRTGKGRNLEGLRNSPHGWRLMLSPEGALRTEGFANYALDNGAYTAHTQKRPWSEPKFIKALERFGSDADFVVVPDVVLGGLESLDLSLSWLPRVSAVARVSLIAVQNGMTAAHLSGILSPSVGVFVGGNDEWKEETAEDWAIAAHAAGAWCHVGRVNTQRRIRICQRAGVDSIDGSGVSKYGDHLPETGEGSTHPHEVAHVGH